MEPLILLKCPDGGVASPECEFVDGKCQWEGPSCNDDDCTPEECGAEPNYEIKCPDGGVSSPVCEKYDGVCGWHASGCPGETL